MSFDPPSTRRAALMRCNLRMLSCALGLAPRVTIARAYMDQATDSLVFVVEGPTLPAVRDGEHLPYIDPQVAAPAVLKFEP